MSRRSILLLVLSVTSACVRVPNSRAAAEQAGADAAWPDELAIDGGSLRPDAGAPYRGPECDPAAASAPHAASLASDAGAGSAAEPNTTEPHAAQDADDDPSESGASDGAAHPGAADAGPSEVEPGVRHAREGELIITEIMSNPEAVSDTAGEWFELHNPSASDALDIGGCSLEDGAAKPHAIPAPFVIEPGEYVAIARGSEAGFEPDLTLSFSLGNSADMLVLRCDGREVDGVAYAAGFPLASGASMSLDPSAATASDNDVAASWCLARDSYGGDLGTPGAANPPCQDADAGLE